MSEISEISLRDLITETGGLGKLDDKFIKFFCNEEVKKGFLEINNAKDLKAEEKRIEYLIKNEEHIDKEKLLLCIYLNYRNLIEKSKQEIRDINKKGNKNNSKVKLDEFDKAHVRALDQLIPQLDGNMKKIVELGKDMDTYLVDSGNNDRVFWLNIISSKEEFGLQKFKTAKRLNNIESEFMRKYKQGIDVIVRFLSLSDLSAILPTKKLWDEVRENILFKYAAFKGVIKGQCSEEEYDAVVSEITPEEYSTYLSETIYSTMRLIDVDKLLLLIGYRVQEVLESENIEEDKIKDFKFFISQIIDNIINKDIKFKESLEDKTTKKEEEVEYSYEDLKDCLARFAGNKYKTKAETDRIRKNILTGKITLDNSEAQDCIRLIMLDENEINQIMGYSTVNFEFGIKSLKLTEKEIEKKLAENENLISLQFLNNLYRERLITIQTLIALYSKEKINAEFCTEFSEENDISSEINLQKINEKYLMIKRSETPNKEEVSDLNTMIEFYKIIKHIGKSQEELEEQSNNVINTIGEEIEGEEDLLFYYRSRLITLQTLADWSGKSAIEKLYEELDITFEDIEKLNMQFAVKQAILGKIIINNIEIYETAKLLRYIYRGYLSEEDILKVYEFALLNVTYADGMLSKGIISHPTYIKINDLNKKLLEEQAGIKSSRIEEMQSKDFHIELDGEMEESKIALDGIPLSKKSHMSRDEEEKSSKYYINEKKAESLINPSLRWSFLKTLKCKRPADEGFAHRNPESPFYDYDFFIIENGESDEAQKDSIIIGERFFKDRMTEEEFATKNATYIWKFQDYLVAKKIADSEQQKNKKAITKETDGVVYVSNHRPGSWAVSLLYKIAQAMAGESFNKYKKGDERATKVIEQLEKLYTTEELRNILEMARILDDEEKLIMPNGEEIGVVYEVTYDRRVAVSHEDDDDEVSL